MNGGSKTEDDYQRSAGVTNTEKKVPVNLPPPPEKGDSRDKAAAVVNVSPRSVESASRVIECRVSAGSSGCPQSSQKPGRCFKVGLLLFPNL